MTRVFLSACLLAAPSVRAQDTFRLEDYLDDGYRNIVLVDFAQLRASGVWDELNTGTTKLLLGVLDAALEVPLERLDCFRMVPIVVPHAPNGDAQSPDRRRTNLLVVESVAQIAAPEIGDSDRWGREQVGGRELIYRKGFSYGSCGVAPRVRLTGSVDYLRAKLKAKASGQRRPGLPCPDILSLLSARKAGLLGYAVTDLASDAIPDDLARWIADGKWPAADRPQFLLLRAVASEDADDRHLAFELVVRHAKAGKGVLASDRFVTKEVARLIANRRLRPLRKVLQSRKQVVDGCDLSLTFDFGRARTAMGKLQLLAASGLFESARLVVPPPPGKPAQEKDG